MVSWIRCFLLLLVQGMPIATSLSLNESRRDVEQASGQPGDPCADAASCDSGQCLGGTCCQPNPTAWTNCADCGWNAGFCLACVTGYSWVTGAGCTAPVPSGYFVAYTDTWCGDVSLYDATSPSMLHTTADSCAQKCNDDPACQFFVWGWNPSGYYRCATLATCNDRHNYLDGDPNVYQKVGVGGAGAAVGDPHLQNVHGERFDLMKAGKHVLINIPRGMSAANALLHVQADARRMGGHCADMYFQDLNVTGAWAEAKQAGGYRYGVSQRDVETPGWVEFGSRVQLKVVHGRTDSGLRYLNLYVKHLGRAGFAVGGLLGEDDHGDAAIPPAACAKKMSLLEFAEGSREDASVVHSVAEATLA